MYKKVILGCILLLVLTCVAFFGNTSNAIAEDVVPGPKTIRIA